MKKILALLLSVCLVLSMTGCGISEDMKDLAASMIKDMFEGIFEGSTDDNYDPPAEETTPPIQEVLDLSQATMVEKFYEDYYVFTGATREMAEAHVRQITDAGYEMFSETVLENVTEEHLIQDLGSGEWGEHCTVCFYKDTLVLGLDMHSYFHGDMLLLAGVPQEQLPEYARWETPENTALPDWSAATPLTLGEYTCKMLTGVSYQQVENYALWMACRENTHSGTIQFDNFSDEDHLFIADLIHEDAAAYADYQVLVWYGGTAILADIPGTEDPDEYVFWTYLDARYGLGDNFLRKELVYFKENYVGSGMGSGSGGCYVHAENCTVEDFEQVKAQIIAKGYVENAEESAEGNARRYYAMRKAPCGGGWYMEVFFELILEEDGYMEAEVSFLPEEGTNWD